MTARMSKTLAAEIARRALAVTSPMNRAIALGATMRRHGFDLAATPPDSELRDEAKLRAWLLSTYAARS